MTESILEGIAAHVAKRVERHKQTWPVETLRKSEFYNRKPADFAQAFKHRRHHRVIAEVKFASPSEGLLLPSDQVDASRAARIATSYLEGGAAAVSILTERNFFGGAPHFLEATRRVQPLAKLLMKDFILDPYQLEQARSIGADCILLIVALLKGHTPRMLKLAQDLGLSALVEVHNEDELGLAREAGAKLVGVNSRDLNTLKTDLGVARRLAPLGQGLTLIAESGLKGREELDELSKLGYHGFLIGSSLMKQPDPGAALKALIS